MLKKIDFRAWFAFATSFLFLLLSDVVTAAERVTYHHFDALGSPVAASDEQGNIIWRETYQPYGERIQNQAAASANTRWYTGHAQDAETGLVYAGARYYDPIVGRFMAVDPKGFSESNTQSFNRYAYGNNNPYKYVDPDGRVAVCPGAESAGAPFAGSGCGGGLGGTGWDDLVEAQAFLSAMSPMLFGGADFGSPGSRSLPTERVMRPVEKPDFVVTRDGVAVPVSQGRMRQGFDDAGFSRRSATQTDEPGVIHEVPTRYGPIDVRTMDGGTRHPRRAVTTRAGTNDPTKLSGERFPGNVPKEQRRNESHLEQTP